MRCSSISNPNRFTSTIPIEMIQFDFLQIRLSVDTVPETIRQIIILFNMMGNKSNSVSCFLLAHSKRSSMTFMMNFMKLSASSVNPRRINA